MRLGVNYQLDRAWANAAKAVRQCQKADKLLLAGKADSAANHFNKALGCMATAVDHLAKAGEDADIKAGNLLDAGMQQLDKAVARWAEGDVDGAVAHYDKALGKFDEALDLID
jgi:tetratricopeptide (TPR) repeat protein